MAVLGGNQQVAQAFTRFGLGGRPDDPLPGDATQWLIQQLDGPDPMPTTGLPTLAQCMALLNAYKNARAGTKAQKNAADQIVSTFNAEVQAYLSYAVTTAVPFRERLVWFWANHFALLTGSYYPQGVAGTFIRDAIRPYVNGTFQDMLLAVMQHPAMLYSLDNVASIGPDSSYALQHLKSTGVQLGFNENLGRECLELHTVGVNAGYTQADVDALAYMLTGWTVVTSNPKGFFFDSTKHQPGSQTLLGTTYPGTFQGGIAALTALANDPNTYNHIATQLVQHFTSDTPDPADVTAVQNALAGSGGNLKEAAIAVVGLPNAWLPLTKFRAPQDHAIAALRAVGATAANMPSSFPLLMSELGMPTWNPSFPNGFSDEMADWLCPQQMIERTDWTRLLAQGLGSLDPLTIAGSSLGPFLTPLTQQLLGQLSSVSDQFQLLFCSPEFQRR